MNTIFFTKEEVRILEQTIGVPFEAFGNEDFKKKIGNLYAETEFLYKKIESKSNSNLELNLSREETVVLLKSFLFARDICDPVEFSTLTGFSWDDSDRLIIKIIDFVF